MDICIKYISGYSLKLFSLTLNMISEKKTGSGSNSSVRRHFEEYFVCTIVSQPWQF